MVRSFDMYIIYYRCCDLFWLHLIFGATALDLIIFLRSLSIYPRSVILSGLSRFIQCGLSWSSITQIMNFIESAQVVSKLLSTPGYVSNPEIRASFLITLWFCSWILYVYWSKPSMSALRVHARESLNVGLFGGLFLITQLPHRETPFPWTNGGAECKIMRSIQTTKTICLIVPFSISHVTNSICLKL